LAIIKDGATRNKNCLHFPQFFISTFILDQVNLVKKSKSALQMAGNSNFILCRALTGAS